jgi:DNA-directed RNA polymerase subunit RPC12/RpoP
MSESVYDLIVRGVAAAKTGRPGSREEARFYLEKALRRDDAEPDQRARAWLCLSQIEDDPGKRREYLESVLAIDPGNGSAHQALAIMDGRLKAEDVIDPERPIEPVEPDEVPLRSEVHRPVCPKCGGRVSFDVDRQSLACSYCGEPLVQGAAIRQAESVKEQDFFATLPTAKGHRWELPAERTLKCDGCGAAFMLPPLHASGVCPFCGSAQIVTVSVEELIQPTAVLPFRVDGGEVTKRVHAWINQERFRPGDLADRAEVAEPRGAYVPFWTFDLGGTMSWHAQVAERRGRTTKWVPRTGLHLVYHDDLLVPASHSLPAEFSGSLLGFDTQGLIPFSADLLAGYTTGIYQVPLDEASLVARQRALQEGRHHEQRNALAGERYRDFVMNSSGLIVQSYKLVLLPFWISGYRYRNETFPAAVNGQTGLVAGRVPRSGLQKLLAWGERLINQAE